MFNFYFLILFFPFVFSASRKRQPPSLYDHLMRREIGTGNKILSLSDTIFELFETNKISQLGLLMEKKTFDVDLAIPEGRFPLSEETGRENLPVRRVTFRELLGEEKSLYLVFAKHMNTCPFIKDLIKNLASKGIAEGSSIKLSILGFIDRLGTIYRETIQASERPDYFTLFDLLLDYTLGKDVNPKRLSVFSLLGIRNSRTFGYKVVGKIFPFNTMLSDLEMDRIHSCLKALAYSKSEIELSFNILGIGIIDINEFLESLDELQTEKDMFVKEVISEMKKERSILKPFVEHSGKLPYERLISLMDFCNENTESKRFQKNQCVRFLRKAPSVPVPALNLLFGYFIRNVKTPQKSAFDLIMKLSDQERISLKRLQPQSVSNFEISDPNCKEEDLILRSLLEIGLTDTTAPIYSLVWFSIPYILNPNQTIENFIKDLVAKAEKDVFLKTILNYKEKGISGISKSFISFLYNCPENSEIFTILLNTWIEEDPSAFNFYFRELVKMFYYPGLDLRDFLTRFGTPSSQKMFLKDLWDAKHGRRLGFADILKFFPKEEEVRLTESISYKKNFNNWLYFFVSLFEENIINKKIRNL